MSYSRTLSFSVEIDDFIESETRDLANRIVNALVLETPVDSGLAKANWLTSVNSVDDSVVPLSYDPISKAVTKLRVIPKGAKIYIQNNLPYIGRLNDGYSQKAPSKFVDTIVAREVNR